MSYMDAYLTAIRNDTITIEKAKEFGDGLTIKGQQVYSNDNVKLIALDKLISIIANSKKKDIQETLFQKIGIKIANATPEDKAVSGIFDFSFSSRRKAKEETINKTVETTLKTLASIRDDKVRKSAANDLLSTTVNNLFKDIFMSAWNPKLDSEKVKELHQYLAACKYDTVVLEQVFAAMPFDEGLMKELKEGLKECIGKKKSFADQLDKVPYRYETRSEALQVIAEIYEHRFNIYLASETEALAAQKTVNYVDANLVFHKLIKATQEYFSHSIDKSAAIGFLDNFVRGVNPDSPNPLPRHKIVVALQSCFTVVDKVMKSTDDFNSILQHFKKSVLLIPQDQFENAHISDMIALIVENCIGNVSITMGDWTALKEVLLDLMRKKVPVKSGDLQACKKRAFV